MPAIDDLGNLPLSQLFSGPLIAAIDANVQAHSETVEMVLETGFDEQGDLIMVSFNYTTTELNPDTGNEHRVVKTINLPLLLFLTLPNLVVSEVEEEFSAEITQVEETENTSSPARIGAPLRLYVAPSSQSSTFDRETKSSFDLNIRMLAELDNKSVGMEMLEQAANNAMFERVNEQETARLSENESGPTIAPDSDSTSELSTDNPDEP